MRRLLPLAVLVAALAAPAMASAANVVLKVDRAHGVAAVDRGSRVQLVRTARAGRLHVGDEVALAGRRLDDGTMRASKTAVVGHAGHAAFRGLLLARNAGRLVVSAGGAVIAAGAPAAVTTATPGAEVDVTVALQGGRLVADGVTVISATSPGGRFEGDVAAIGTGTVTVASEHLALVLNVPAGTDLSALHVGDDVLATFAQQSDGTLTLTALVIEPFAEPGDDNDNGDHRDGHHDGGHDHDRGGDDGNRGPGGSGSGGSGGG